MASDESQRKQELGSQAANILESEAFKIAVQNLRDQYVDSWMKAQTVDARESCHKQTLALTAILLDLRSMMTTGMLERKRIEALQATQPKSWSERLNG